MKRKLRAEDEELPKEVEEGGRQAAERVVNVSQEVGGTGDAKWFHRIAGAKDITRALEIHRRIRRPVRQEAAGPA